jgi:hypothetical protein
MVKTNVGHERGQLFGIKEISNAVKTDFCIGVAGYPEKTL